MRIAFLGTPEAAVPSLRALVESGHDVEVVVTRPDRKRGRGGELSPSPVKSCALELGLPVRHRLSDVEEFDVQRGVVVAYGRLIPAELLERVPMLNVHFSLLPRWRGAAPVERAILAGDRETGVSIMTLDADLDTGPVHLEARVEIGDKTLSSLLDELAALGARALVEVLGSERLLTQPRAQSGDVTYAAKLEKGEFRLDPSASAAHLLRIIRLGRAFMTVGNRRLLVESASPCDGVGVSPGTIERRDSQVLLGTAHGALTLERVRPQSGNSMSASAWWMGARFDGNVVEWT